MRSVTSCFLLAGLTVCDLPVRLFGPAGACPFGKLRAGSEQSKGVLQAPRIRRGGTNPKARPRPQKAPLCTWIEVVVLSGG